MQLTLKPIQFIGTFRGTVTHQDRYATRTEALIGHKRAVDLVCSDP